MTAWKTVGLSDMKDRKGLVYDSGLTSEVVFGEVGRGWLGSSDGWRVGS